MASKSIIQAGKAATKQAKPTFSKDLQDARRRVLNSYKQWMKHFPEFYHIYKLPYTESVVRAAIKNEFTKNAHLQDVRIIDRMIHHSETELRSIKETWTPSWTIANSLFAEYIEPKSNDFLSKFFTGKN